MNTKSIKIVAIGDSITYGYPYGPALSWLNLAAERTNIDYLNVGINGDTTAGMLNRFNQDVLGKNSSHVIIMGGTNDIYSGIKVDQVMDNIRNMVKLAVQNGIIPIIGLPIPCNDLAEEKFLEQYREEICQFSEDNNIEIIDFYRSMVNDGDVNIKAGLHCDGVHPNNAGYEVMVGIAYKCFVKIVIDARGEQLFLGLGNNFAFHKLSREGAK